DRTFGTASVTTRSPPGRTVRRIAPAPSLARNSVRVEPGGWSTASTVTPFPESVVPGRPSARLSRRRALLGHGDERQLAARVDLGDLHLDLVADLDDVLDLGDPLVVVQRTHVRHVQQTVATGQQRDERAERSDLHDRAQVPLADLGELRVGD